jgi:hypothetical protein
VEEKVPIHSNRLQIGGGPGYPTQTHKPLGTIFDGGLQHGPHNPIHKPVKTIHLPPLVIVIKEIHTRIQHSSSRGGHHTTTIAGTYWTKEDMDTLHMIWMNGIKKGEDPVVDAFMTRMVG